MIYFDHAATSMPKPPGVYEAVNRAMRTCASIGRSGHEAAVRAAEIAYEGRQTAAGFFDADPEQIVFTYNATHGLNIAIHSLVNPGDSVVISGFEHNAVLRPLHHIGADIHVAGRKLFQPDDTLEAFARAICPDTKAVICTHVSNVFGYVLPVKEIAAICQERGVPFILDAAQSAGVLPVSFKELHAAFIAMPGHKSLYGPQGTGLLLCGQVPKPFICGGTGSRSQMPDMPDFLPDVAEAGTHNIPGIAGLTEGLRYIQNRGIGNIRRHEQTLLKDLHHKIPHITQYYAGNELQTGVLSVQLEEEDCEIAAQQLAEAGFAVRAGLHCAPLAHESAGTLEKGTIRISISDFNTEADIDALAAYFTHLK